MDGVTMIRVDALTFPWRYGIAVGPAALGGLALDAAFSPSQGEYEGFVRYVTNSGTRYGYVRPRGGHIDESGWSASMLLYAVDAGADAVAPPRNRTPPREFRLSAEIEVMDSLEAAAAAWARASMERAGEQGHDRGASDEHPR
jgi:hypothetical protein